MVPGVIGYILEYRGVTGTPPPGGGVIGPHGPKVVEEERQQEVARSPPCPNPNWEREGGVAPLLLVGIGKGGQNLLGVGLPPLGTPPPLGRPPPPSSLYIRRRRAPHRHNN